MCEAPHRASLRPVLFPPFMSTPHQPSWLKDAVFYQIYPQSFYDSNADGVGDIPGIIAKLDHVQRLGCNAIWLNPVFVSPFADAGYDVSDFCRVAPRYGSNDDLARLFTEAHRRGIKIVLDLVAGHTSVEHPWFKESMKHAPNACTDRYIWTDSVWGAVPPTLQALRGYGERNGCAVVNFFWCQPALNYGYADPDPAHSWEKPVDHPACLATLEALKDVMRFWLELGADGFRVDMAQSLIRGHDEVRRLAAIQKLWRGIRGWFDVDYPEAVLISEWSYPIHAVDAGFHIDFMIHFETVAYNSLFRNHRKELISGLPRGESFFDRKGAGDIRLFLDVFMEHYAATRGRGYISVPTCNHDTPPRLAEDRTPAEYRCALLLLLTLPAVPFIYYGDEIGMRHAHGLASKEGGYERTGVRTPMQWDDSRNAGFSSARADELYLPVEADPQDRTVAAAERDPESVLHFVRRLIALRKEHPALGTVGDFRPVFAEQGQYPFIYERTADGERFWIAVNPAGIAVERLVPERAGTFEAMMVEGVTLTEGGGNETRVSLAAGGYGLWRIS